jgi:outer membrane protein assembly factor BamB
MRSAAALLLPVLIAFGSVTGQPYPEIKWWTDLDAPSFGSAATADLDGDGLPEIVFGTYFNDEAIHCLNGEDGSSSWTYVTGGCNDSSPVICDVDDDGQLEVVVPCSSTQTVYCIDGATGDLEWSTDEGYCIDSPPAIADVDLDGDLEVVNGTFNGHVFCLDADSGQVQWQKALGSDSYIQSCPNIHDFDGDGEPEIVVAQWMGDCRVYCLDGATGDEEWHSDAPGDWMYHGGSFADVDGDGLPEIAIGCYDSNVYLLNGEDGSTEWTFTASSYACGPTSIADLDCNGDLEVVYTTGSGIGVISSSGSPLWYCSSSGSIFRGAVVTNIDSDTIPDLIYGTSGGDLTARRGSGGELLWELDLQAHYGNTYDIDHAPVTGDFDGDGSMDVFVIGGYGTSSSPADNHGRAYMISAGDGQGPGWSMFRHDRFRSGCLTGGGTGIEGAPDHVPGLTFLCAPNPCTSSSSVVFSLPEPCQVSISVYDLTGRRMSASNAVPLGKGENRLMLDTAGLIPGVYFVRVSAGDQTASGRLLVIDR